MRSLANTLFGLNSKELFVHEGDICIKKFFVQQSDKEKCRRFYSTAEEMCRLQALKNRPYYCLFLALSREKDCVVVLPHIR